MKQLVQNFKNGELKVENIPTPVIQKGGILVRTINSLLSVGTEKMISEFSKKSLIGKALARPDLVKQVMDKVKKEGIVSTIPKVKSRLESLVPLGYSCAGEVLEVGDEAEEFCVGDRVACAGMNYASHGEVNFVPKNLCVKIPDNVDFEEASFVTLGSIALQGVRQADVKLGEKVVVIGLGLLGLLTVQFLKASGCKVLGSDIDPKKVELAAELGADVAILSPELISAAQRFSQGYGVDAVIITASTSSNGPIETAGEISKHKGKVVVVGMVSMNVPRNLYYKKELDLRLSMSYGPGRYDPNYEEKGIDYPFGYVRWTEKRNMETFLQLISEQKLNVKKLITHRFNIEEALKAYELVMSGKEFFVGVTLNYPRSNEKIMIDRVKVNPVLAKSPKSQVRLAVVGAGNFTKAVLLPKLQKTEDVTLSILCDIQGANAMSNAQKFGFTDTTSDYNTILNDKNIDAVVIATRHNLHAKLIIAALEADKHVYVEKPLAMNRNELNEIVKLYEKKSDNKLLMVGFNRRFAPLIKQLITFMGDASAPFIINYRINAGFIPKDSWIQDPEIGGGRIIGEVCHFVDLVKFLIGSQIIKIYAESISGEHDNVNISLKFKNGSIGNINYIAVGDTSFPKERIEVFGNSSVAVIDDFKSLTTVRGGRSRTIKNLSQDKGHAGELKAFVKAIKDGGKWPISLEEMISLTNATFDVIESLNKGAAVTCPA